MSQSIAEVLQEILAKPDNLPPSALPGLKAELMAILWDMEASRIEDQHPWVLEAAAAVAKEGETHHADDEPISQDFLKSLLPTFQFWQQALLEKRCWQDHGCPALDYVIPAFFGAKTLDADEFPRPQ